MKTYFPIDLSQNQPSYPSGTEPVKDEWTQSTVQTYMNPLYDFRQNNNK